MQCLSSEWSAAITEWFCLKQHTHRDRAQDTHISLLIVEYEKNNSFINLKSQQFTLQFRQIAELFGHYACQTEKVNHN